jgi:hypothetical protein
VERYEEAPIDDRRKAALRYADAHMTDPRSIDAALRDELHRHFTPPELVELALDVVAWNKQKVPVSLEADRWVTPDDLTPLSFDARGGSVIGEPR